MGEVVRCEAGIVREGEGRRVETPTAPDHGGAGAALPAHAGIFEGPGVAPSPRWARVVRGVLLAVVDTLALAAAWALAYWVWGWRVLHQDPRIYLQAVPLLALYLLAYAHAGLYPGFGIGPVELLRRLSGRTSFVFLVLVAATYWLKLPHQYSRVTISLAWLGALMAVPLARHTFLRAAGTRWWWREPAVVVGRPRQIEPLMATLASTVSVGYRPAAVLRLDGHGEADPALEGLRVGSLADAQSLAACGVRVALLVSPGEPQLGAILDALRQHFPQVILFPSGADMPVSGAEVRDLGGFLGIEFTNHLLRPSNRLVKRAMDLVGGLLGLLVGAPVVAVAAAAVKMTSPGPAFFCQERVGVRNRRIRVFKIRTMHANAEALLASHLARDEVARREWQTHFKLRHDPRIVPGIGHLLRRFSLDELPQLASVVAGTMSLVGPRPFPHYHLAEFSPSFRTLRAQVRPGLTGLWQVSLRSDGSLVEQEALDTYYIRNWSLWLDLYILGKTFFAVLQGKGAR